MRQIVLDTETTGLEPEQGHRIIEIGCVELVDRRLTGNNFHQFLQPEREIDAGAIEVHGITNEFLADKPRFCDVAQDFVEYVRGAELIIHNAPFDVGFLDHELKLMENPQRIDTLSAVTDTLVMAKKMHPGQRNSLDALCKRYDIDNSHRELHGALLDAEILADVYLMMTGGQAALVLDDQLGQQGGDENAADNIRRLAADRPPLKVILADESELEAHQRQLEAMGEACIWHKQP
ncbi:MAG: DNA polymerase III subunit epsilon [Candidatus Thiodiazotropha lotti]|uniref:DNA polymerase III subunit epsilon n=1 Tax=Candidatus Thiodiazotropha endoloripes TaxID=1818881 RepID=A0A1E2UVC9_9GAMM|nr:DNA polymerase III subunit epsilon [Candidatus Thiodiazotropha endoloripes]MCG7897566.1 DNA polymerase III subunit epsilon [Candidatus Thiodiazotropha weberae]MCG7992502.1 DNA polymerase III subunit epsilon [Candidatus Thiodiazotropha lotti]MCG7900853.1 DNA polymerase III subunit epsilon [Candidatus Thiodiazotropha weberae]MCG7914803.1 DNA polymerase III subunit epsilon [Candidatus Thiodiazotropha weberae]MCG7999943.1 DNA polymerase III subunit epsilon [Candidatus Thiodiazotropha lotti]